DPGTILDTFAQTAHVSVECCNVVAMLQHYSSAVAAFPAGELHPAAAGGLDWGARRCRIIGTFVWTNHIENRMAALQVEGRRDPGVDRHSQEGLAHALAIGGIVVAFSVGIGIQQGKVVLSPVDKTGRENPAGIKLFAIN